MRTKLILLPNGDRVRNDTILAIRLGDEIPAGEFLHKDGVKPRVIVDFGIRDHANCAIVYFDDNESRDAYAQLLSKQAK